MSRFTGSITKKVSDKVLFDSIYINNFSFFNDIKLIMQTVMVIRIKESSEGVNAQKAQAPEIQKNGV